jgi:hypothetical protein
MVTNPYVGGNGGNGGLHPDGRAGRNPLLRGVRERGPDAKGPLAVPRCHRGAPVAGGDARVVVPDRDAKSIGAEDTFDEDLEGLEALKPHVHSQALRVGRRLRRAGVKTRVVQLKLKFHDFTTITRRTTLESPTDDGQELYRIACAMLERAHEHRKIRLTGVSAQDLDSGGGGQLGLFAEAPKSRDKLNAALDKISRGANAAASGGKLPATLAEVTIVPVPQNPATGQPFAYSLNASGFGTLDVPAIGNQTPQQDGKRYVIKRKTK